MTTWSTIDKGSNVVLSNGNLTVSLAVGQQTGRAVDSFSTGKLYWEYTVNNVHILVGWATPDWNRLNGAPGFTSYYTFDGNTRDLNFNLGVQGPAYTNGDVVSVAIDFDAGKLWWGKNGVYHSGGDPATGANPHVSFPPNTAMLPAYTLVAGFPAAAGFTANFGQTAFSHSLPTGFSPIVDSGLTPVETFLDISWGVGGFVEPSLDISWGVGGFIEDVLSISWRVLNGSETSWSSTDKCSSIIVDGSGLHASIPNNSSPCNFWGGRATKSHSAGKWYFEVKMETRYCGIGVANASWDLRYNTADQLTYYSDQGTTFPGALAFGDGYLNGDIVGVAVDLTNGLVWFSKNGVWQGGGDPVAGTGGLVAPEGALFPSYWLLSTGLPAAVVGNFAGPFATAEPTGFAAWDADISEPMLVSDLLEISWQITSVVDDSLDISWQILSEVTDSLEISWQTFNTMEVLDSLGLRWGINGYASDTLPISWQIEDFVTLSAEDAFQMSWQILEHVSDSQPISWRIDGYAQAEQEISWPINTYVTATVELSWSIIVSLTVPEDEYTSASDLAARLIAKKGRPLILRRREDAVPSDPARPWAVDRGGVHDHQMYGVVLDYHKRNIDGELIKRGDKRVLVAASELVIEPAPGDTVFERDGSDEWTVVDVEVLRPGETSILYTLQIRR